MAVKRKDWLWIQKRYEMGFTVRQIALDYCKEYPDDSVSFQAIAKMAKMKGWGRELTDRFRKAVELKVIKTTTTQQLVGYKTTACDKVDVSEDDISKVAIDEASEISAQAIIEHRYSAQRLRYAAMALINEIHANEPYTVVTKDGGEFVVQAELTKRAQALNIASKALAQAVIIERTSLNLDHKGDVKPGGSVFHIISNVPEPDPLPPGV
jgi:hypothetical protein